MAAVEIPWQQLSDEALTGVIEEFVSREGTEYGAEDVAFATKISQVRAQLERGGVLMFFDPDTGSCQLLTREDAQAYIRASEQEGAE